MESHERFRAKYQLTVPLLADPEHKVCEAYGVWKNPGVRRNTFVIDEHGIIAKHYMKVDSAVHAAAILAELAA